MNNEKTKKIKIEYVLVILIVISICFILFGNGFLFKTTSTENTSYSQTLKSEIINVLSQIKGVGNVNCYITFDNDVEEVFLKNTTTITKNDTIEVTEEFVLVNGKPYKIKNQYPSVTSLIVVCEGADDIYVKTLITNVLTTALEVPIDKIQIYKMK